MKRTLILNGSPRAQGDTVGLIDLVTRDLPGEIKLVNTYRCDISPCVDCRFCWKHRGCAIQDEMQEVYDYLETCDNVLIASPIYFSELTGKLLDVGSRLQTYFCGKMFREEAVLRKSKRGAVILVGGGDGNPAKAYETACTLLRHMNCHEIHELVCSHGTNERAAREDVQAVLGARAIAAFFAEGILEG